MPRPACLIVSVGCLFIAALGCTKDEANPGNGGGSNGAGGVSAGSGGVSGGSGGVSMTGGSSGGAAGSGGGAGNAGSVGSGGAATTGSAGSSARGGTTGSGAIGGNGATAGSGGTAVTTGTGGSGGSGNCTVTVMSSAVSTKIPTVGIVTFTTTAQSPTAAHIDFGLDSSYGMTAPVDLTQANYRTLLLGMKPSKTYHFQISVTGSGGTCTSADTTMMTGAKAASGLPTLTFTTNNASAIYGGFLVAGLFVQGWSAAMTPAFIVDKDGDFVWWYFVKNSDLTGVTMSYDGKYMWLNSANVPQGTAHVHRVSMDGLTDDDYSTQFTNASHQLTVLPDDTVAFYAYNSNGCDDIKLRSPSGTVTTVVNAKTAHGGSGACHVNALVHDRNDDTLVFSDLDNLCLTKVTRTGQTVWILNGGIGGITSTFSSGTLLWKGGQHGFQFVAANDIVLFNNNNSTTLAGGQGWGSAAGDGSGSIALELKLDTSAKTATQVWSYKASPGIDNQIMGDVQRLPNGNTMVDYATKGAIHEVDSKGNVLQTITTNSSFGYIQKRATLYGPPPR